ncbi:Sec-independent protein translocase family protein [Glycomyces xiaoerkulensis]|uniref:hypothetical protein n=1 Tax=Glycomyces xiaoerkulensis TaxID=2038139 RepID=UPI000C25E204|nr:hypothetical protein [Glycomyces xiaoerkulensis]
MFGNIGTTGFLILLLLALFLWGPEKIPHALASIRRFIVKARNMASNAASDLSRETGIDVKPEDLNPRTFVRKHVLSEEDQEMLTNPLKSTMQDLEETAKPVKDELNETTRGVNRGVEDARRGVNGQSPHQSASKAVGGSAEDDRDRREPSTDRAGGGFEDVT